jgi:hypothetical protein
LTENIVKGKKRSIQIPLLVQHVNITLQHRSSHEKMNSGDVVVAVIDPWSHAKTLPKMLGFPTSLRLFSVVFWLSSTASPTKDLRAADEEEGHG